MSQQDKNAEHTLKEILVLVRVGSYRNARDLLKQFEQQEFNFTNDRKYGEQHSLEELRLITLRSEIIDYFGDSDTKWQSFESIGSLVEQDIRKNYATDGLPIVVTGTARKLLRQKLFLLWQLSCWMYHRTNAVSTTEDVSESSEPLELAIRVAKAMEMPTRGLLAQLLYGKARLLARQRRFDQAIALYHESLLNVQSRLEHKTSQDSFSDKTLEQQRAIIQTEVSAAAYSTGKILALGIGNCYLEQGRLAEAHSAVFAGILLLQKSQDTIHQNYAHVILAEIERTLSYGSDGSLISLAEKRLEKSIAFFQKEKIALAFRARYQLALLHMHRETSQELALATELSTKLEEDTKEESRWRIMTWVLQSRIKRRHHDYDGAYRLAKKALAHAESNGFEAIASEARLSFIRTLVADSENKRNNPKKQKQILENATQRLKALLERILPSDAKSRALPLLILVEVLYKQSDHVNARKAFQRYLALEQIVQDPRVRLMARVIESKILPKSRSFICPADELKSDMKLEQNISALKKYLAQKCDDKFVSPREGAKALGVGMTSYYKLMQLLDD